MKVAIICPQGLPVPAVKGGAIETLVELICRENEIYEDLDIDIYSIYDEEAKKVAKSYNYSNFIYLCKNKCCLSEKISKAIKKTLYFVQKDGRLLYKLYKNI